MSRVARRTAYVLIAAAFAAFGIHHVPPAERELVVRSWAWGSGATVEPPGFTWRLPLLTRLRRYPAGPFDVEIGFRRAEGNEIVSREGAPLRVSARLRAAPDRSRILDLHGRLGPRFRDPTALASCLLPALRRAAAASPYNSLLMLEPGARSALEAAFSEGASMCGLSCVGTSDLYVWPEVYPREVREPAAGENRILVVGVDGADWTIADPLIARGEMPNLAGIVASGVRARMKSITPMLSPIIWTSLATGKQPEKHGIIDFLAVDARTGASIPVTSTMRKARAFWEILSGRGVTVGTIGWWATWPSEPLLGFQVSDRVAYQLFGQAGTGEGLKGRTWPEGLMLSLAPVMENARSQALLDARDLLGREPEEGNSDEESLLQILTSTRIYHAAGLLTLKEYRPRALAIYYEGPDTVSHLFLRYAPPRMPGVKVEEVDRWGSLVERYYRLQDRLLGELLAAAGSDPTVLIASDHGFKTGAARPLTDPRIEGGGAADWHRKFGIFAASGPGIRAGGTIEDVSVLDLTPTLLALLGLPAASDMDGAVIEAALAAPPRGSGALPPPIATYESEGGRAGGAALANLEDPAAAGVQREIIAKLTALGYIGQTGVNAENNAGLTLLRQGRYEEAAAAFRAAAARDPNFHAARVNMARALMAANDFDGALAELTAVREADPNALDVDNLIGNVQMERDDLREAEATFRRALSHDPSNPHLWNSLGIVLSRQGRVEEARRAYERVVETEPDYAEAINNIGLLLRDQGRLPEAVEEFERAIRADGDFPGSYNNLGLTLQDMGDQKGAIDVYDRGLKQDPENPVILNNKGSALLALGRTAEAKEDFERAVAIDPNYPSARNNLGAVFGLLGDQQAEFEEYLKAIELDPNYTDARYNLALNLVRRGRSGEAEKALRQVIAIDPDHARGHFELGVLVARDGRIGEAIPFLEKARALSPRWIGPRNALARALAATGRAEEAVREARASLSLDPNQPEMARMLKDLRATSGSRP